MKEFTLTKRGNEEEFMKKCRKKTQHLMDYFWGHYGLRILRIEVICVLLGAIPFAEGAE